MTRLCIAAGILTLFTVAVYMATGHSTIFRPGPLSRSHGWLDADCASCHRPWSLTRGGTSGCVLEACHAALLREKDHRRHAQAPCSQCHVEHATTPVASGIVAGDSACLGCHAAKLEKDHPTRPGCVRCHFFHVAPRGSPPPARETAIAMNHSAHLATMADVLAVKDRNALCGICHVAREGLYRFAPFTRPGCNRNNDNCHALAPLPGQKKFKDCLAEKPISGFTRPEPANALFVHSKHIRKYKCTECHSDIEKSQRVTRAPLGKAALCARCHCENKRGAS